MIITKTIKMKVNGTMVKKYKEMGYDVKQYDIIELPVEKLTKYSHQKILCSCDVCGNEKEIKYNNYCKYINDDNIYTCNICNLEKRRITCIEMYGVDNVSKNEDIKKKVKKSMKENNTDYGFRSQQYKDTLMKNYGVTNPSNSLNVQLKKEKTCFKNYGVKYPAQCYEIYKKQQDAGLVLTSHESGLYYRGSYEKHFIDFCIDKNIKIENFKGSIDYYFDGKNRKYFPDFLIKETNTVIEIKSSYTYECKKEQNEAKKIATINSGYNFKFIINKDYNNL